MATFGRRILRTSAIPRTVLSPAARVLPRPRPRPAPLAALPTGWAPAWRRSVSYKRFGDGRVVVQSSSPWGRTSGGGASGRWSSNPRLTLVYWAAGLGTVWIVFHLDQVPETGRWRYLDTSEKMELAMGDQVYRQTLDEYRVKLLPPNHPTSRYVAKVAQRIIMASELPRHEDSVGDMGGHEGSGETGGRRKEKIEWKVHVINDPNTLNAFVTPGGKVFVFTGILPVCKNEDGLAAVLAHETAHVIARHVAERMSMGKVAVALAWAIDSLLGTGSLSYSIVSLLVSLPNSRTNEAEADHIGLNIMARACYDPREAQRMWERMEQVQKTSKVLAFVQTHPANADRIRKIGEWLPEAERQRDERCGFTNRGWDEFDLARKSVPSSSAWR